jgi:DNA polymerase-3 subunit delta'
MARDNAEAPPESDRFDEAPHPRHAHDLIGHGAAETEFLEAFRDNRLPQAWIIGGPEGIGKATLAWRMARFVFAHPDPASPMVQQANDLFVSPDHPAAHRVAAMSHGDLYLLRRTWNEKNKRHYTEIRAEDARAAIDLFHHAAGEGGWRVAIVDAADDLNKESANALLKMIEEPPPRSLFLIVAHRPARLLPTIRSRCRMLRLEPLSAEDVARVVRGLGKPWTGEDDAAVMDAAQRGGGSVRAALRLLGGEGLALTRRIEALFERLPHVDWVKVSDLAEAVGKREAAEDYETVLTGVYDWIDERVRGEAGAAPLARLARYSEVWEKIAEAARETEALNLDRRPLILSIFANLSEAAR